MADDDLLRRYVEAGIALTQLTRVRAEAIVRELVKLGDVQREQTQDRVDELLDWGRKSTETLVEVVRKEVGDQLTAMGFATKDEVERLRARFDSWMGKAPAGKRGDAASEAAPAADPAPPPTPKPPGTAEAKKAGGATKAPAAKASAAKATPATKAATAAKAPATKGAAKAAAPKGAAKAKAAKTGAGEATPAAKAAGPRAPAAKASATKGTKASTAAPRPAARRRKDAGSEPGAGGSAGPGGAT
ncbi:MAG TPA: hypothetical protein VFJ85_04225 [Acidimicrobiales bacterium]|nr:hypothetical protein [Acidimicrobiales bacterium]